MRISDWSSDVCSSDLDSQDGSFFGKINRLRPGSPLPSLLTALTRKARNPEQRCPVSLCSRGAGFFRAIHYIPSVMEVETAPTTKGRPREFCVDKALEIGRASCRERVCQYV